jgi:hypothetical protein
MTKPARKLGRCAYCGAPLVSNAAGVVAWRIGNQFVCNEFCADGVPDVSMKPETLPSSRAPKLPLSFS